MNTESNNHPIHRRKQLERGQGLAEYSLIIALVSIVCVSILIVLGRATKNTIYKVTCSAGSTDSQCSCINEKLTVTSTYTNGCNVNTLSVLVTSSCSGTSIKVNGNTYSNPAAVTWASAPVCTGGATSFAVTSTQPNGTVNNYNASRP